MSEKVRIDVKEVASLLARMNEINSHNIRDIIWVDGDKEIDIPTDRLEEWRFMGLCNTSFIEFGLHEHGFEDIDE